ncbi:MAG: phosphate acyltransferase [Bacteroidetes bacterium]|nr:phosphate acyltransferase [Bacteroidota bacterium]MBT4970262.1 phosphate acyltransferase [Bacteroidota bacterium]MBT5528972.1 phosphate acyltransferase [Cytophagia bacterium]MBT6835961.1 phosphate acyltransferase [Bacteroidota bacterium]MBT7993852.1 phosphate acyltransferase [Bacteroidota bacterium]
MRIGLDLMGGDYAPLAALEGVAIALDHVTLKNKLVLFGDLSLIEKEYTELFNQLSSHQAVEFVNCTQHIKMSDSPTKSFSAKPESSIAVGYKYLASSQIDVFIGSGNTGAMMVGAFYAIKPIEGVIRPTITSYIPQLNGKRSILLDVGVNPDVRQDVLFQFGILGSVFSRKMEHIEKPRVALLNIGAEKEKGNLVSQAAYSLMEASSMIEFVGNIEGYDLFSDKADVIVCDGFTGNIALKLIEGFYKAMKSEDVSSPFLDKFNYENYGGTPILGINRAVLIGHGISSPVAFNKMINLAETVVDSNLVEELKKLFRSLNDY